MSGSTGLKFREKQLPLLPGYSSTLPPTNGKRNATLTYKVGAGPCINTPRGASAGLPAIDLDLLQKQQAERMASSARSAMTHEERRSARESARSAYRPGREPDWLKNDKKVLHFYAYHREAVHEDSREAVRVRRCTIDFFLEDGSMCICEPRQKNSGLQQGTVVKRHKIPKSEGGGFYSQKDLACRTTVKIYSHAYRIYDCDEFTRQYYEQAGGAQPPPEALPDDLLAMEATRRPQAMDEARKQENLDIQQYYESLFGGGKKNRGLEKYLENDRKVLRFHCIWDDPTSFGVRNFFTMHYYLADETVEVNEVLKKNSGRGPWPVFFQRGRLYKNPHVNPTPGMISPKQVAYQAEELQVGTTVMIYGRELFIYDCDEFTRNFYAEEHGIEQGEYDVTVPEEPRPEPQIPPHTGLGTEEDTLAGCKSLMPRAPKKDINKLMLESHLELRFEAQMVTEIPEYQSRRFRIIFFIGNETVAIDEISGSNSGFYNGKFCTRARVKNTATGTWFKPGDFFPGAAVEINSVVFTLTRADQRTLNYMEKHTETFPLADASVVASKVRPLAERLHRSRPVLLAKELQAMAEKEIGLELLDHELITLARRCGSPEAEGLGDETTIDLVQVLTMAR
mmetsp:Transcript_22733/g.59289  ORF Transcript_22733/g.59289 Transcript_22733/m.59289 type:complete len:623 (-) Transcript_22733:316-2184(-)